ncbi:hypothetical protein ABO04_02070 [Nitrosomonas sp. HPC101]|uniref:hypothetical protein n=1 Tax=Nitrosomonas sp. HPC101 TaxID=1658667 RepID=UPI00136C8F7A|nr:hypothetical protein [Nitrosomonas sp. HPC101]MXS84729.1 hypothetical protein [Nitrosomonas sp. HPC101]
MTRDSWRKRIIWGALAATVLAALLLDEEDETYEDAVVQPVLTSAGFAGSSRTTGQPREVLPIDQLGKRKFSTEADDIFPVTSWEPKLTMQRPQSSASSAFLPRQPVMQRPPAPELPPLPFEYLGKVSADGKTRIFLAWGDENHVVAVGARISGQYRVDRIREDAVELTYLPLGIRQTLLIN